MTPQTSISESYEVTTSDNRRYIVEAADPETIRRNFPVAGETIRVLSVRPIIRRDQKLTVHELVEALSVDHPTPPHWQTLLTWARDGRIPVTRVGRKFLRFIEKDVRTAMERMS